MDPVSTVEAALVAGAAASTKDIASQTVKDAYDSLRMELRRLLADKPRAWDLLDGHEADPQTYEKSLKKVLTEAQVDQNADLLAAAREVLALAQQQQVRMGKSTTQNTGPIQSQIRSFGNQITRHLDNQTKA